MSGARAGKPVFLVKGDDPSLLSEAVRGLAGELVGDDDPALAVEDLSAEEDGVAAVLDACLTVPFLTSRRIVVVRGAGAFPADDAARLVDYLENPLDTTTLVLVAGGGQLSPRLANAVRKVGEVVDASLPSGRARTTWLVERLRHAPVHLDAAAAALLGEHLGEDLGRLTGTLDALASAYGEGARLGPAEVTPFLGEAGAVAPWDLTDAIDRGDTEGALDHLHRMMAAGERHPLVVMASLHRHYAAMLRLDGAGARDENEAAALLGTRSTFPAKKALAQSRRLGPSGVRRAITLLADADLDVRGARAWPDTLVMEVLVARLSRLAPRAARARDR